MTTTVGNVDYNVAAIILSILDVVAVLAVIAWMRSRNAQRTGGAERDTMFEEPAAQKANDNTPASEGQRQQLKGSANSVGNGSSSDAGESRSDASRNKLEFAKDQVSASSAAVDTDH